MGVERYERRVIVAHPKEALKLLDVRRRWPIVDNNNLARIRLDAFTGDNVAQVFNEILAKGALAPLDT